MDGIVEEGLDEQLKSSRRVNQSLNLIEGLISFESIAEVILDVILNDGNDFLSKWLDEEGKGSWEGESLVETTLSFSEIASWSFRRMLEEEVIAKFKTSRVEWNIELIRWQNFDLNEVGFSSFDVLKFSSLVYEATKEEHSMTFGDDHSSRYEWLDMKGCEVENSC